MPLEIKYPEIGICGLSCRLCPNYYTEGKSRCGGCKSQFRMGAGCPFITCAIKKKGIEFCWLCEENTACEKWHKHRELGKRYDSFKCYQKLEDNLSFIQNKGINAFLKFQTTKQKCLEEMLQDFNEGRSKRYCCIAATVLETAEIQQVLAKAKTQSPGWTTKEKSKVLHSLIDAIAKKKNYLLKLRKYKPT